MEKISGDVLGFKIGNVFVSCEVSCSISLEMDPKPATTNATGGWNGYIAGNRGWSATLNGNLLKTVPPRDVRTLITAILNGSIVQVEMATQDAKFRLYGNALVRGINIDSTVGENVGYNGQLIGDGVLNFTQI